MSSHFRQTRGNSRCYLAKFARFHSFNPASWASRTWFCIWFIHGIPFTNQAKLFFTKFRTRIRGAHCIMRLVNPAGELAKLARTPQSQGGWLAASRQRWELGIAWERDRGKHTGWSNWILLRRLKYFICCLRDPFLFLGCPLSNITYNTSISGVKSS